MCTILVSGVSGIIGYGILRSLRQSHPHCRLVGTTVYERTAARAFCDVFEVAPRTDDKDYFPWLVELINHWDVLVVIPGIEADVFAWNEHREIIKEAGAIALLNKSDLIRLCADKWAFYERLMEHKSPYAIPTSLEYDEILGEFPLLAKPRRGSGSKGVVIINNRGGLEAQMATGDHGMMFQPIIGTASEEYTCSAMFDMDSRLCAFITLRRTLSSAGFTENGEPVKLQGIEVVLPQLGNMFKPVGPTNFQVRVDDGKIWLLEINPRISSATSIRTAFGYNESAMAVDLFLKGITPIQPCIKRGYAARYTEDMVFYDGAYL